MALCFFLFSLPTISTLRSATFLAVQRSRRKKQKLFRSAVQHPSQLHITPLWCLATVPTDFSSRDDFRRVRPSLSHTHSLQHRSGNQILLEWTGHGFFATSFRFNVVPPFCFRRSSSETQQPCFWPRDTKVESLQCSNIDNTIILCRLSKATTHPCPNALGFIFLSKTALCSVYLAGSSRVAGLDCAQKQDSTQQDYDLALTQLTSCHPLRSLR